MHYQRHYYLKSVYPGSADCGTMFLGEANIRIHEGHKNYKCESCCKSYFQAGNLKTHAHIKYIVRGCPKD